jgi:hypothetical protein
MYELLHNKTNSNYFIINIKLKFPESGDNQMIHVNLKKNENSTHNDIVFNYNNLTNKSILKLKNKYINVIRKWIQNILDQYSLLYNSVLYITNLNYDTIRIFIYFNPLNYSNMDNNYAIYLTDMIKYDSLCKLNILEFIKLFQIEKLNLLIDLEFDIIKPHMDTDSSSGSSDESDNTNNHTFDIIDYDYFDKSNISDVQLNKKQEHLFLHHRYNIIKIVGVSGINKLTFLNEIQKISIIEKGNIYPHNYHKNYDTELYVKIKENNKHMWISYEKNTKLQYILQLIN